MAYLEPVPNVTSSSLDGLLGPLEATDPEPETAPAPAFPFPFLLSTLAPPAALLVTTAAAEFKLPGPLSVNE